MPSLRSKLLNLAVRGLTALMWKPPLDVAKSRASIARQSRRRSGKQPDAVSIEDVETPLAGRWLRHSTASGKTILYLHGGAFLFRMPEMHTSFVAAICAAAGMDAFLPWYRLAPEHPFPAAPDDCLAAYRWLLETGVLPGNIVLMGDSAGGNLTLALLHLIKRERLPMPSQAIALSPITDFTEISATWLTHARSDPMFRVQEIVNPQRHYLQGAMANDPIASPYFGDLNGFPPILCVAGGAEALEDDSVSFVRKALEAGVDAEVHIWRGQPHVHMLGDGTPEARLARAEIVRRLLGKASVPDRASGRVKLFNVAAFTGRVTVTSN